MITAADRLAPLRTAQEVAETIGLSPRQVLRHCRSGRYDAVQVGDTRRSIWLIQVDGEGRPLERSPIEQRLGRPLSDFLPPPSP